MWGFNSRIVTMTIGLILLVTGIARAEYDRGEFNSALKGTFRFSTVKTCTEAVLGSTVHFYFNGAIVYDGNGSAKLTQQGIVVLPGSTSTSFEESAQLTYVLKLNGSFVQEGTFVATDHSYTVTGARMIGQIDAQGSIVILSGPIPAEQETVTSSGGSVSQYFCGASGTAVRIP
ncbi:MAG TPA: hypothetical protein PKD12_18115 [Nitrospira sp.]|nr:hypothetical protein [Nitrospira sp.]